MNFWVYLTEDRREGIGSLSINKTPAESPINAYTLYHPLPPPPLPLSLYLWSVKNSLLSKLLTAILASVQLGDVNSIRSPAKSFITKVMSKVHSSSYTLQGSGLKMVNGCTRVHTFHGPQRAMASK